MSQNREALRFTIAQVRQDKIILAVEALVVNSICFFCYQFAFQNFANPASYFIGNLSILVALAYTSYVLIGNLFRLKKIKKLERRL